MTYQALPSDQIAVPTSGQPECLLTWVKRPGGGIRLYASRNLRAQDWGQRTEEAGPVDWHLGTSMRDVLIVDRETPAEAIQWVLERWLRDDAEFAAEQARIARLRQHAIAGMVVHDPKAITTLPGI